MSTIELFTTTPARLITPTPLMMMPNGIRNTVSPISTPTVDRITELRMIAGFKTESNCETRMKAISSSAVTNAPNRNAADSCCSSCWPV